MSVSGACVLRGTLITKFEYIFMNSGKVDVTSMSNSFDVVTENSDIKLSWKIEKMQLYKFSTNTTAPYLIPIHLEWKKITLEKCDSNFELTLRIDVDKLMFLEKKIHRNSSLPLTWDNLKIIIPKNSKLRMTVEVWPFDESLELQLDNYKKILESNKFNDVTFAVADQVFPANTNILSVQSPVFSSMFETDMTEKNKNMVEIFDIEPNILKNLLNYTHRGKVEEFLSVDDLLKLLVAADKYCISSLVSFCKNRVSSMLTSDCVVDVLIMADLLKVEVLKRECKTFIFENKAHVVKTERYKNFVKTYPDLLSELFCEI